MAAKLLGRRGIVWREALLLSFKKEQNLGYRGTRDCFVFLQFGHNTSPPFTAWASTKSPDMPKTWEIKCSSMKDIYIYIWHGSHWADSDTQHLDVLSQVFGIDCVMIEFDGVYTGCHWVSVLDVFLPFFSFPFSFPFLSFSLFHSLFLYSLAVLEIPYYLHTSCNTGNTDTYHM